MTKITSSYATWPLTYIVVPALNGQLDCGCFIEATFISVLTDGKSNPIAEFPIVSL